MKNLEIRQYMPDDLEAVIHLHNIALKAVGAHTGSGVWDDALISYK